MRTQGGLEPRVATCSSVHPVGTGSLTVAQVQSATATVERARLPPVHRSPNDRNGCPTCWVPAPCTMGLERSLRRSDQPCGQHHRSIVRSAILLALVVVALTSQLALLKYNECSDIQQTARSFQVTPNSQPLSEQSSLSLAHQLPLTHRVASSSTCIDSRSHRYAPASWEPRVSLEHQRQFALGKYNLIAKGSGEINACGPLISYLSHIQHSEGIFGTLAEFGVHHGRFTGFLFTTARATEKLVVGDLFAQQDKNVDKSGLGDKKMFLRSLETYGMMPRDLHALIEASTDELPFDLNRKAKAEPFRMISVDASHT